MDQKVETGGAIFYGTHTDPVYRYRYGARDGTKAKSESYYLTVFTTWYKPYDSLPILSLKVLAKSSRGSNNVKAFKKLLLLFGNKAQND